MDLRSNRSGEITRGPTSVLCTALTGLAGLVNFITMNPDDDVCAKLRLARMEHSKTMLARLASVGMVTIIAES